MKTDGLAVSGTDLGERREGGMGTGRACIKDLGRGQGSLPGKGPLGPGGQARSGQVPPAESAAGRGLLGSRSGLPHPQPTAPRGSGDGLWGSHEFPELVGRFL